ncbi:MAG: alpha/beta fold hydrolase [Alphaproteobacteria bacterium]|jgi:pimeloyl-ACP methyl ester carboxylesterase|nr:alpha/beta fold hydrolase [Alphaproteobacteria bacterium]
MTGSFSLIDQPDVLDVLFHPRRDYFGAASARASRIVDVETADGVSIGGRLYAVQPDSPLVLFFHGNGEIAADYEAIAPLYRRLGIALLVMDYRGYGTSTGTPTAETLVADARAIAAKLPDMLAAQSLAPARRYVMGRSLGSASALEIAAVAPDGFDGLIIESGFAHTFPLIERLRGWAVPGASEADHGFNNLAKIGRTTLPTLIIHGEQDWIIPVGDGRDLYEHCPAEDKRLVTVPNAGHNDLILTGQRPYFDAIQKFINGP